ncbi:MAG: Gfo/Idh/MocA family oxidoreductase [Ferruginibacter sp.]|nr:Gfo/Idh/MocA family oxidoreductase [Cytophagales bacterium]
MSVSRRKFLRSASQLAAGAGLATVVPEPLRAGSRAVSANDTVRLGLIGCKNMGWANLTSILRHPGVSCIALCDVDRTVLHSRAADLAKMTANRLPAEPKATLYGDFRKLLDNKDIDAVIVGTPDHWHCLPTVYACEAGKDVYVEKPIANTIEECNLMVAAANRYGRVVQVGQWQRSGAHWNAALDYVRSGKLGRIRTVKTWAFMPYGKQFPPVPDGPVPAGVDYETWLGPAPQRPFNQNRFHGSFRYFWDYAGGLMTDWGVHMIDMALSGMRVTAPRSVVAVGGKFGFPDHAGETPDTMQAVYDFGEFTLLWEQSLGTARGPYDREHGVAFIGNLGTLVIDRNQWEVLPEVEGGKYLTDALPTQRKSGDDLSQHTLNFLECIKSRQKPHCSVEIGRDVAVNAQIGNIAYKLERRVFWDAQQGAFLNDPKANELTKAHYRAPWKLPKV